MEVLLARAEWFDPGKALADALSNSQILKKHRKQPLRRLEYNL
jgi:hypothetical protein